MNFRLNNTYIYNSTASCGTDTTAVCNARLGGLFDEGSSSSWNEYPDYTALEYGNIDGALQHYANSTGKDILTLSDQLSLGEFPFALDRAGAIGDGEGLNKLGLGYNSSLLRRLMTSGNTNSQTWSIWQGWSGAEASQQIDGNIVLGGYDRAKLNGANVTQPIVYDPNCAHGLIVTINDITMNLKNGSSVSISGTSYGQAIRACVEPTSNTIGLPHDTWGRFIFVSGSTELGPSSDKLNFWSQLVLTAGAWVSPNTLLADIYFVRADSLILCSYDGDLSFTIDPNLNIRIPNHQLVVPEYNYSSNGQRYYTNATETTILIYDNVGINENDLPTLGKPFLSSAYLLVDNDRQSFTLWEAQPNMTQDLVSLGPPICSNTPHSAPTASPTSTSAALPSSAPTILSSGLSKSTIAGIVIGGSIAVATAIGAILFIARTRRHKQTQQSQAIGNSTLAGGGQRSSRWGEKPEMASDQHPPLEMPVARDPGYSLAPYEVPDRNDFRYAREPQEMPSERVSRQTAHEMPATPISGRPC